MNNSNQRIAPKWGVPVAKLYKAAKIREISGADKRTHQLTDEELQKVEVSLEFREKVMTLLRKI